MWDKKSKKVFSTGVNAVGAERDFYTLDKLDDPYLWEHMYSTGIEPLMSKVIPSVISRVNILLQNGTTVISATEKAQLALIMVIQMLRGKQCREYERKIYQNELPNIVEQSRQILGEFTEQEKELVKAFSEDEFYFKRSAMDAALNQERITRYAKVLCTRAFVLFYLCGKFEFLTSDSPVMFFNIKTGDSTPFAYGLLRLDTYVCYPLSPKLLLCAVHPSSTFYALIKSDCRLIKLNSDSDNLDLAEAMNRMQASQSYRQTYAKSEDTLRRFILK